MASSDKFMYHRSVRSLDMLFGIATSILLHSIFLVGSKYWYKALIHEPKQEISQELPIEIVEVPPNKTDIPPQTSFRATKNSLAGGKASPERPVSVVKSAADNERSFDLKASSPLKIFQTKRQQQKTESPKTASASASSAQVNNSKKIAVAPVTTPQPVLPFKTAPNPKQIPPIPATTAQVPNSKKIAVAPITTPLPVPPLKTAPNPKQIPPIPATTAQVPNSKKIAVAPITTPLPVPPLKTAPNPKQIPPIRATTAQVPNSKKIAVAPVTTPQPVLPFKTAPNPKQIPPIPATTAQVNNSKKIAVAPVTTPQPVLPFKTAPNPKQIPPIPATTAQVPNSKKIAVAPMNRPQPAQLGKTALERATTLKVPSNSKKLGQSRVGFSGQTPTQAQSSLKTGAASLLGGTVGVSSQNYRGDQLASLPNSNRDRIGTPGVDASSQDIDLTSYLNKLKQRVQQQWLPGMSQSSRRTVLNFIINRSGEVSNLNIVQTSGFHVTDEVALNAIQRAAPFAPLPTGYPKKYIDIEFTFDINVYGELNLWRDGD